jgi:hypothetical protein
MDLHCYFCIYGFNLSKKALEIDSNTSGIVACIFISNSAISLLGDSFKQRFNSNCNNN